MVDLDGGGVEIINCGADELRVYALSSRRGWRASRVRDFQVDCARFRSGCRADFDGDGRGEYAFLEGRDASDVRVVRQEGDQPTAHVVAELAESLRIRACADFDGDGRDELLLSTPREVPRLLELEGGVWSALPAVDAPLPAGSLWPADLNRDGRADLMTNGAPFITLLGRGDGHFDVVGQLEDERRSTAPILSDLNGDGAAEVLLVSSSPQNGRRAHFQVFENLGDGRFEPGRVVFLNRPIQRLSPFPLTDEPALLVSLGGRFDERVPFTVLPARCLFE